MNDPLKPAVDEVKAVWLAQFAFAGPSEKHDAEQAIDELLNGLSRTYRLWWEYTDKFRITRREHSEHLNTLAQAEALAELKFELEEPDVWWIESVSTVAYHQKEVPF